MSIWCNRGIVTAPLCYALCTTEFQFREQLRRMKVPRETWPEFLKTPSTDANVHFFYSEKNACAIVCIRLRSDVSGVQIAALLVHEAVHIWQEIRDIIGEKSPSKEFEAYSIQAIAQELMLQYQRQTGLTS